MTDIPAPPLRATYRLQLNASFGFADAHRIAPYLARLGISHLYASPITMARPGSTHGYDVIDFNRLNPELGEEAEFEALIETLHAHGMGLVLDFVPNHMGVGSDNPWWLDVLEWGRASPYAEFFDIDWEATARGVRDKVLLPVLGDQYGKVLEAGQLKLQFERESGTFHIAYYDNRFPIATRDYPGMLRAAANLMSEGPAELLEIADSFDTLAEGGGSHARWATRRHEATSLKGELARLATGPAATAIEAVVAARNGTPGEPDSFLALHRILEDQAYRLAYWRVASSEINYRRFFDINELAGLRMEVGEVFEATHRLLLRLLAEGKVQGVRLDHIDGLFDPAGYCRRLLTRVAEVLPRAEGEGPPAIDAKTGQPTWLLVEKILARHENLRDDLPAAGTTGYEFINLVNGLFVDPAAETFLTATYRRFLNEPVEFGAMLNAAKRQILRYSLNSELHVLAHEVWRLAQQSWVSRDFTLTGLREALTDLIACFPVYRTYITTHGAQPEDRRDLDWAVSQARKQSNLVDHSVFEFLHAALSTDLAGTRGYRRRDVIATAMHFQQLTGPVMAKSLEDTTFYRYNRLISLNEVGGEPQHFGVSPAAFHHLMSQQQRYRPLGMVTTATHDHKRGEDVRARIDVLSEMPREWRRRVRRWTVLNQFARQEPPVEAPSRNDEYLLYQTLVGAWPLEIKSPEDLTGSDFCERIVAYMTKAIREAKLETSWTAQNAEYEAGVEQFVRRVLDPERGRTFLADLIAFQAQIAPAGALNGLAQTLLKLTAPGVPDTYQGTELWDLSLVDPDNRRPVDFELRAEFLDRVLQDDVDLPALLADWQSGAIKQLVVARTLALRRELPELFTAGSYQSLAVEGEAAERLLAFARIHDGGSAIVVAPRLVLPLMEGIEIPLVPASAWEGTRILLPDPLAGSPWTNVLTSREPARADGTLLATDVLGDLSVALLVTRSTG
jgi:(1->4)-alpha-D-glucan 1-alpha-D-glucosylmutase